MLGVQQQRDCSLGKNFRIKTWEIFKSLAIENKPTSIVYIIAQSIQTRDLTSLKLLLPIGDTQYIFVDTAKDDRLRRTKIPIRTDKSGTRFLEDHDIKEFLKMYGIIRGDEKTNLIIIINFSNEDLSVNVKFPKIIKDNTFINLMNDMLIKFDNSNIKLTAYEILVLKVRN